MEKVDMGLDKHMEIGATTVAGAVVAPCKTGDEVTVRGPGRRARAQVTAVSEDGRKFTVQFRASAACDVFTLRETSYRSAFGDVLTFLAKNTK